MIRTRDYAVERFGGKLSMTPRRMRARRMWSEMRRERSLERVARWIIRRANKAGAFTVRPPVIATWPDFMRGTAQLVVMVDCLHDTDGTLRERFPNGLQLPPNLWVFRLPIAEPHWRYRS